jgi:hypothetical protein
MHPPITSSPLTLNSLPLITLFSNTTNCVPASCVDQYTIDQYIDIHSSCHTMCIVVPMFTKWATLSSQFSHAFS